MLILGIETSCDETAIALVEADGGLRKPRFKILSNIVSSQVAVHKKYGGVVPNLASREHTKNLIPVLKEATKDLSSWHKKINFIAVTVGPGLIPSLLIGVNFARTLAYMFKRPIVAVNHLEGHIYSNWLTSIRVNSKHQAPITKRLRNRKIEFPVVCLIVSGGHTELILMESHSKYKMLGQTRDDAAGEAFDKVARILDLGYPGGPVIDRLAKNGNPKEFTLPRPMIASKDYDFSFAGLKTAMLYLSEKLPKKERDLKKKDLAASFQEAVVDVLLAKTLRAQRNYGAKTVMVSGGVAANSRLREAFANSKWQIANSKIFFPARELTTDNAAMIAMAGYINWRCGKRKTWRNIRPDANLRLA